MNLCIIGNDAGVGANGPTTNWRTYLIDPTTGVEDMTTGLPQPAVVKVALYAKRALDAGWSLEDFVNYFVTVLIPGMAEKTGQAAPGDAKRAVGATEMPFSPGSSGE